MKILNHLLFSIVCGTTHAQDHDHNQPKLYLSGDMARKKDLSEILTGMRITDAELYTALENVAKTDPHLKPGTGIGTDAFAQLVVHKDNLQNPASYEIDLYGTEDGGICAISRIVQTRKFQYTATFIGFYKDQTTYQKCLTEVNRLIKKHYVKSSSAK